VDTGDLLSESERMRGRGRLWCALVGWWERLSLRLPDAVVVRGTAHEPIAERLGARRVTLLPDGVDVAALARRGAAGLRARIGATERVTVGVIATISLERRTGLPSPGWDVVECVARLRDLDVVGVIVGDGPGLAALQALAARHGVSERMRWVGRVSGDELPDWMSVIDVFLHTALNNAMSAVRTTGKLPLLLAAGSAAVVSRVGEAARVLEGTEMLLDFDGTPEEYADALAARVRAIIAGGELERWREAGPAIARREFDYALLGDRAGRLVSQLVQRR
jgi:glycosyltransferase involved in cell wall biosynthesis